MTTDFERAQAPRYAEELDKISMMIQIAHPIGQGKSISMLEVVNVVAEILKDYTGLVSLVRDAKYHLEDAQELLRGIRSQ